MKKTALICIVFAISILKTYSQNTFDLLIENNYDEVVLDVTELSDGNFILSGTFEDPS